MEIKRRLVSIIWKTWVYLKRLYRTQKNVFWIVSALFFATSFYFLLRVESERRHNPDVVYTVEFNYKEELIEQKLRESILEDKGAGCNMPYMDPFSKVALYYNRDSEKIVCDGLDWVDCYQSKCYVVDKVRNTTDDIVCHYKDIIYENETSYRIAESVRVRAFNTYTLNRSDHVKVSCSGKKKNSLNILSSRWYGYKAGLRPIPVKTPEDRKNTINIMILCFDSTSRNGFIRKMPKSYRLLRDELKAVILQGYNIVREGSSNALYPMLTGLELPDWHSLPKNKCLDHKTFLFHHLKEDGYRTAYFEDMPWIGTFQRYFNGFDAQPADHYLRAFFMEEGSDGRKRWRGLKRRYCIGSVAQHAMMMNLTKQFLHLDGKRFCLTFIRDVSHDDFNMISSADDDLVEFLKEFHRQGWNEDTLLIIMGDHGAKYDYLRKTYQGRIEERLPLVAIKLPSKLLRARPTALATLKANAEVLTTPYDMHTTLLDVVGLLKYKSFHRVSGSDLLRGMSLLEPIPKTRSCGEAGILPHWCACAKWKNMSASNNMFQKTAEFLIDYINNMTHEKRLLCAKRTLKTILWVLIYRPQKEMLKNMEVKGLFGVGKPVVRIDKRQYQVKLVAEPGDAIYEASMVYYVKERYFMINDEDVSRISSYGHEADCVLARHPHLDKYCYCVNGTYPIPGKKLEIY